MEGNNINEETESKNDHGYHAFSDFPVPYLGYQDTDKLMAEMRAVHESMSDEDYQRAEEEAGIIWNPTAAT